MTRVTRRIVWTVALIAIAAVAATFATGAPVIPERRSAVPTAKVVKGPLKLTVYATGELRAGRTVNLMAPPAGGSLRILKLLQTGTAVKKDDVVLEFDVGGSRVKKGHCHDVIRSIWSGRTFRAPPGQVYPRRCRYPSGRPPPERSP